MATTMQDVARAAGVSMSTVSFVLNGTRPVAPATRTRIEAAMAELGYRRNALARGLASRRSRIIALALPISRGGLNSTVMEFIEGISAGVQGRGYALVLWPLGHEHAREIAGLAQQGLTDGVLAMDVHRGDARVRVLRDKGVPLVQIGQSDVPGLPFVDIDFAVTATAALGHLHELGHRRIGFINHSEASAEAGYGPVLRMASGLEDAAAALGLRVPQWFADDSAEDGRQRVHEILDADPDITAFVVMNDSAAFGVLQAARERGLNVPGDLSVLSVVSSPTASAQTFPPLTTLHAPGVALGTLAAESLIAALEGEERETTSVLLPCTLALGGSTGTVPPRPTG